MSRFIINNLIYDTDKAKKVGTVSKWYRERNDFLQRFYRNMCGTTDDVGRNYQCELFVTEKGNYFITHEENTSIYCEPISKDEAKKLLSRYPDMYIEHFGEIEEA